MTRLTRVSLALNVILSAALVFGPIFLSDVQGGRSEYIPPGLTVRMNPDEVAAVAQTSLDAFARGAANAGLTGKPSTITQIIAAKSEDLGSIEPRSAGGVGPGNIVWVVRAEGTFLANRGLDPKPRVFTSGYFVIDDALGEVVAFGMP